MSDIDITVNAASTSDELVFQQYRDDETGDIIRSVPTEDSPVPDVGEVVSFGTMTLSESEDEIAEVEDMEHEDESYVVQERAYMFYQTETEVPELDIDDEVLITEIDIYITPLSEVEEEDSA